MLTICQYSIVGWLSKHHYKGSTEDVANPQVALRDKKGNRIFRPRYSYKDVFRIDTTTDADRARIQSPSLSFKTKEPAVKTFRRMLKILDRCGFDWVLHYKGADLGIKVEDDKVPSIEMIDNKLAKYTPEDIPVERMKAVLLYKNYQRIRVKVKVSGRYSSRVKVKVKGPVLKFDWREIQRRIKKRFRVDV